MPEDVGEEAQAGPLGLFLLATYFVGIATTNVFLSSVGLTDFSLIRPRAIFTGALVVGSLALVAGGPTQVLGALFDQKHPVAKPFSTRFLAKSAAMLVLPALAAVLLCWWGRISGTENQPLAQYAQSVTVDDPRERLAGALAAGAQLYLASVLTSAFAIECLRSFRSVRGATSFPGIASRLSRLIVYLAGTVIGLAWYIHLFGTGAFATIPQAIGGGEPERKQLIVSGQSHDDLKALGVEFTQDGNGSLSRPLYVFYESDDFIAFVLPRTEVSLSSLACSSKVALPAGIQISGSSSVKVGASSWVEYATFVRIDRKAVEGFYMAPPGDEAYAKGNGKK
jgi:hypothetical protein